VRSDPPPLDPAAFGYAARQTVIEPGERYSMKQLVDGDLAANNGGWQWSTGTGTNAGPYCRIFHLAASGCCASNPKNCVTSAAVASFSRRGLSTRMNAHPLPTGPRRYAAGRELALTALRPAAARARWETALGPIRYTIPTRLWRTPSANKPKHSSTHLEFLPLQNL
jgi:hypothetical protein